MNAREIHKVLPLSSKITASHCRSWLWQVGEIDEQQGSRSKDQVQLSYPQKAHTTGLPT